MRQILSIEGSTALLPKTLPNTPRFSHADQPTQNAARIIFSRERTAITPNPHERARRTSFGETKSFWVTNSIRAEKQKNSGVEISPSFPELSLELHVSKIPTTKANEGESRTILPLFQSLPRQKKVSFSPRLRPIEAKHSQSDNFLNLFRKVKEIKNEGFSKRDVTNSESPLRPTRLTQSFKSAASFISNDKSDKRSLRQSLSLKLLQLKPVEGIDTGINIQDAEHKEINIATVSESRIMTRMRGHSISNERISVQPATVNNIYKLKVQIKKPTLSQLKFELKLFKKLMDTGKVKDNYIPVLKKKNSGREYNSIVQ